MKAEDFKLEKVDRNNEHEDYWFKVSGETKQKLTEMYMEQGMIEVTKCVYSKDENVVVIKKLFPFNFDMVVSDNEELKQILRQLAQ